MSDLIYLRMNEYAGAVRHSVFDTLRLYNLIFSTVQKIFIGNYINIICRS